MSTNTIEQKKRHKAHQHFRDLLKQLRETGECHWPYRGKTYHFVRFDPQTMSIPTHLPTYNALVRQPRKRGFKVTPAQISEKDGLHAGGSLRRFQTKDVLGIIG